MKEIVIKIDDKDYQLMKEGHIPFNVLDVIKNGTPLPKGHGRLVEAKQVINSMFAGKTIDDVPTIIEAEMESE